MTSGGNDQLHVVLLRHGQVPHHRSDVGLTDLGIAQADAAGRWFASEGTDVAGLLSGETRRTSQSASVFANGYREAGGHVDEPVVSFALRNPDLYLGGHRINMGEGLGFLAAQVANVREHDVDQSAFYHGFVGAPDRIGFWLEHDRPPGDAATDVGRRIEHFARSLCDVPGWRGRTVVAITHSPVLRALRYHLWGEYSREPPFLHGYRLAIETDGRLELTEFATGTGDVETTARPGPGHIGPAQPSSTTTKETE